MNITKSLNKLLAGLIPHSAHCTNLISGLTLDSRKVKPGDLFFAYKGHNIDSHAYINDAIKKGAAAIICEEKNENANASIPIFSVQNLQHLIGFIAARFYDQPSHAMTIIGVTGTNGKTSCTHFIARILSALNLPCGVIGTLGAGFPDNLTTLNNTTPDAITIQRELAALREQGARAAAIEVSSHAIEQERISGVEFNYFVFTNLTRDHLDYHGTMESYAAAKKRLFFDFSHPEKPPCAIINLDDAFGCKLFAELQIKKYGYSVDEKKIPENPPNSIAAHNVVTNIKGISATINAPWGADKLQSHLLGKFNLSNLLAALAVIGDMGFAFPDILEKAAALTPFAGRMQSLRRNGTQPLVVIDYAHTPDALEQALRALREHCNNGGKLWCVFGCGGGRDAGKRSLMGQIAERYSDNIVITSDNPRNENPQDIIDAIVSGLLCPWAAEIEPDRYTAIAHALECATTNDIVLIAGKGHENYQLIGTEKIPFNDEAVAKEILKERMTQGNNLS